MENRSLAKALALIEGLASSPSPLTAVQLSHSLKLTRPTVYRILKTLAQHGFVTREEGAPFYRLSFKLLDLGHQVLERTDLLDAARPVLRRLSAQCHEIVHDGTGIPPHLAPAGTPFSYFPCSRVGHRRSDRWDSNGRCL